MKPLLFIITILYSVVIWGQKISNELTINKIQYDFEVIFENSGIQIAEFIVYNPTNKVYRYLESITTCGCTVLEVSNSVIYPGDSLFLTALFDPKGNEKKVTKSITVSFVDEKIRKQEFFLNISALVITQRELKILEKKASQQEKNVAYYFQQKGDLDQFLTNTSSYQQFIKQATKMALMDGKVNILITIYNPAEKYHFEKVLKEIYKSLKKDIENEGVPESKIIFENPIVELSSPDSYIQLSIIETVKDIEKDLIKSVVINGNKMIQNLPVFIQYFKGGLNEIDTISLDYKNFIIDVKEKIDSLSNLRFLVINSASNTPSSTNKDNNYIVNVRQKRIQKQLQKEIDLLLLEERFTFKNIITGPKYSERFYFPQYYYNFQYVKIIPYFETPDSATKFPNSHASYEHFFKKENQWINVNDPIFQEFLNHLIIQIENNGYVNLLIEGSSSKIQNTEYKNNDVLAYSRIVELKKALERELYKNGVNPMKLSIIEELTRVQGPTYNVKNDVSEYQPYQYVKAFIVD